MVNPYETSGNGITSPDQFIGRRETLARILEQVVRGESIQIVGPLKIGRTSLLRMIAHPSVGGIHGLDPDRFTVILMDLHELAGRAGAHEFYRWMLSALCDALPEASSSVSTATPFSQLCQALRRLDRIGRRVVFACDNFEFIERLASDPDLLSTLRALASRHASLVVTTLTPLDVLLRPYSNPQTSPLWNVLRRHDLGVYSPEEAELMIRCPQSVWSPESSGTPGRDVLALEWVSRIQGYVGTHPYLLQLACAEVYELQRLEENRFEERHRSLVEDWLEHLSQDARLLLTALRETPPPEWGPILEPQYPRRLLVEGGWLSERAGRWWLVPFVDQALERVAPLRPAEPDEDPVLLRPEAIMIADICSSTELTTLLGFGTMRRLKGELHDALLRFGEPQGLDCRKSIGDGYLLSFPNAFGAVMTACDTLRWLLQRNTSKGSTEQFSIRCAVHFGEVAVLPGDREGPEVVFAFRMEGIEGKDLTLIRGGIEPEEFPHENYILVSEAVAREVKWRDEFSIRNLGYFNPRGQWAYHPVYQVIIEM